MFVLETLGRRWFAFGFLAVFAWSAVPSVGWRHAARFWAISIAVYLPAELSSTRNGFPFGRYAYLVHDGEAFVSNVPLFVAPTFGIVVWAGRECARAALPRAGRAAIVAAGAFAAAVIDLAIDPMTLRGDRWFLGSLYAYEAGGWWFGVPWSNFGGWALVSAAILGLDAVLARNEPPERAPGPRALVLPAAILGFFVVLAAATGFYAIAAASAGICAGFAAAVAAGQRATRARRAATVE